MRLAAGQPRARPLLAEDLQPFTAGVVHGAAITHIWSTKRMNDIAVSVRGVRPYVCAESSTRVKHTGVRGEVIF